MGESGSLVSLVVLLVVFGGIFYFLLIRPQRKKQQEHQDLVDNLQKGDEIVTAGGIHGKIFKTFDENLLVTVEDGNKLRIERDSVVRKKTPDSDDKEKLAGGKENEH